MSLIIEYGFKQISYHYMFIFMLFEGNKKYDGKQIKFYFDTKEMI